MPTQGRGPGASTAASSNYLATRRGDRAQETIIEGAIAAYSSAAAEMAAAEMNVDRAW
jgi:hypothetical protein